MPITMAQCSLTEVADTGGRGVNNQLQVAHLQKIILLSSYALPETANVAD